jgi:NADH-quinone oxidoreductase subunit L
MISWCLDNPGRLYVVATLLPLAAFVLLLIGGLVRTLARPYREANGAASFFWYLFGGDKPLRAGAYLATGAIGIAAILSIVGLCKFIDDADAQQQQQQPNEQFTKRWAERTPWAHIGAINPDALLDEYGKGKQLRPESAGVAPGASPKKPATTLEIGYRIDYLTAVLFAMVCVISTFIFLFSIGYMKDEAQETTEDHEVTPHTGSAHGNGHHDVAHEDGHNGHLKRRGRYGRFFLFLSLFCFSMLNLVIADNLFQVFVSWELVGVCSFLLIGFYYERNSASTAANTAFIVNRIGDAGFLIGLAIVWTYFGTFNFQEIQAKFRSPPGVQDAAASDHAGAILRGDRVPGQAKKFHLDHYGKEVLIVPEGAAATEVVRKVKEHRDTDFNTIPYWLLTIAGIGIFLGCVGKSAQFPLHTWLPDAMEGPTPVSALIHAATMVAAGVYLVGRAFPLFTPEVQLTIAYTGAITLFIAATIALVQNDIKRVLAYSTVSQLGYMMLSLGVGGWTPGLLHLFTHAFFKALMFLAAGAVIFGMHHEQDLRKMGGLRRKMPITAYTFLIGVLAIAGTPFFSGWYSKDQVIGQALGYGLTHKEHILLAVLPLLTAALTAFYMFRLWFMAFAGTPRDADVYEHAKESPWVMLIPLIVLAAFSLGAGWGGEIWNAEGSYVGGLLHKAEPTTVHQDFAAETHYAHEHHHMAGLLALAAAALGAFGAVWIYGMRRFDPETLRAKFVPVHTFLMMKWYFDELYNALFVMPIVKLAFFIGRFDKFTAPADQADAADRQVNPGSVDGFISAIGLLLFALGLRLRAVQSGMLRRYVLVLVLTTVVMFAILSVLAM